ncbi:hypothetical protein HDU67_005234 [Dinochytrium kinnereticum]|nr:hypothetical protein HDU67_005234 [Dinochytrium kinnereticum]
MASVPIEEQCKELRDFYPAFINETVPDCCSTKYVPFLRCNEAGTTVTKLAFNYLPLTDGKIASGGRLPDIEELAFKASGLQGPLPPNLGALFPKLRRLDLSSNGFIGTIPITSFEGLTQLESIDLSNNSLTGPVPNFSNKSLFPNLTTVKLKGGDNRFEEPVLEFSLTPSERYECLSAS